MAKCLHNQTSLFSSIYTSLSSEFSTPFFFGGLNLLPFNLPLAQSYNFVIENVRVVSLLDMSDILIVGH